MSLKVLDRFPGANARVLSVCNEAEEPEVRFAADPQGGPEALWFCLRVTETEPGGRHPEKLKLTLCFFQNLLGCRSPADCRPVYQPAGKGWFRSAPGSAHRMPDGRIDVSWTIPYPETTVEFALCYPYGKRELSSLLRKSKGTWRLDTVGLSQRGRPIERISNDYGTQGGSTAGLYFLARQHSGETPGSWVLDGVLDRLSREKKLACVVWAVPFCNVDGVVRGEYGKDNFPYDLNRAWGVPPMRHETLVLQRDMQAWTERCKPRLVIDFHAPGGTETAGVYCFLPKPESAPEVHADATAWAHSIQDMVNEYAAQDFVRTMGYGSRWETPTAMTFAQNTLSVPAFSVETPYASCGTTLMNQKQYRDVGRLIAKAILNRI